MPNKYVGRREFEQFLSGFKDMKGSLKILNEETGTLTTEIAVVKEKLKSQGRVQWGIWITIGIAIVIQLILRLV